MKKISVLVAGIVLLLAAAPTVHAQFNKVGRTAFQFLKIGVGARQSAIGEASISSVQDVNSVFWDPANIAGVENAEASFSNAWWFADMKYVSGAVAMRLGGIGVGALSIASLNYGDIPEALVTVPSGSSDTRTGSTFTGGDLLVGASFSHQFTDHLAIGVGVKWMQEKLYTYTVSLPAFDIGTFYDTGFKGIRIAMSAQNFAGSVKWLSQSNREEGYDIPLIYRIGASVDLIRGKDAFIDLGEMNVLTLSTEAIHTNDYAERLNVGAEYWFNNLLALRAGYRFNYDEGNWSFGAGVSMKQLVGYDIRVDFAYVSYQYLDSPTRLSLSFAF